MQLKWRVRLAAALATAAVGIAYFINLPHTPRELFETRCSHCHTLPNLSKYARHEFAPLIDFMRDHNGARRVISDDEAAIILEYLESTRE